MWFNVLFILSCTITITIQYDHILQYECETNLNCTNLIPNSMCVNRKCICQFGYKSGRCASEESMLRYRRQTNYGMRMLGDECDWTNQCRRTPVDGTKVCLSGKCQCSPGYVPIDAYRCIQDFAPSLPNTLVTESYEGDSAGYGSVCSNNSDCQHTTIYLECLRGTCICLEGYVPLGKYLCFNIRGQGISVVESSTSIPILSSTTSIYYPINNEVIKSLGKLGNTCTNDYFCRRVVSQSHCYNGKCTCFDGYIPMDQYTCTKDVNDETTTKSTPIPVDYKSLLGGKCVTKRNCHTSNAICLDYICTCPKGYFPIDDWTCLEVPESSEEELMETTSIITETTTLSTTTVFRWWPWSPTPTTRQPSSQLKNTFRVRCLLNRQCASMDENSHCTLFGRCICNQGYQLETANRRQSCVRRIIYEDDCD